MGVALGGTLRQVFVGSLIMKPNNPLAALMVPFLYHKWVINHWFPSIKPSKNTYFWSGPLRFSWFFIAWPLGNRPLYSRHMGNFKGGNSPPNGRRVEQHWKVGDLSTMLRLSTLRVEKARTFFLAQNAVFFFFVVKTFRKYLCKYIYYIYTHMAIGGGAWGFFFFFFNMFVFFSLDYFFWGFVGRAFEVESYQKKDI